MRSHLRLKLLLLVITTGLVAAFALLPGSFPQAYPNYHDPATEGQGYCATCHPGFVNRDTLHDLHKGPMTNTCNLCHTGSGRGNPFTMWSADGTNPLGCMGCHGRDQGETIQLPDGYDNGSGTFDLNGLAKASGYGLRKQHLLRDVGLCLDCHDDVPRSKVLPEDTVPPYYPRADVLIANPCSGEDRTGDGLGLDNDGDNRIDNNDPDCNAALTVTPGEAGAPCAGAPLTVTGFNPGTGDITINYGVACSGSGNSVYAGPLTQADISAYNYSSVTCAVGNTGTTTFNPGAGSFFFILSADDSSTQGSYGEAYSDVDPASPLYDPNSPGRQVYTERPDDGAACGLAQDLLDRCD
jgi:hypothetical protein